MASDMCFTSDPPQLGSGIGRVGDERYARREGARNHPLAPPGSVVPAAVMGVGA